MSTLSLEIVCLKSKTAKKFEGGKTNMFNNQPEPDIPFPWNPDPDDNEKTTTYM